MFTIFVCKGIKYFLKVGGKMGTSKEVLHVLGGGRVDEQGLKVTTINISPPNL
jgi:hypothetical protein